MIGDIFNSKGVHVGTVAGEEIFGLQGQKLCDLKGSKIYWSFVGARRRKAFGQSDRQAVSGWLIYGLQISDAVSYLFVMPLLRERANRLVSGFVEPRQPTKAIKPPSAPGWVHEIKHDGFRLMVRREGPRLGFHFWDRAWTKRPPMRSRP